MTGTPHKVLINQTVEEGLMADQLSRVFAALADPTRRDMVARLTVTDATVNELAEPYEVSIQAVSKHLKVLEDAGLVTRSRKAQTRPVHLEAEVFDLMTAWIERYRRRAEQRYRRLDAVLAELADSGPSDQSDPSDPFDAVPRQIPPTKGTSS
jgi:DNA-binding transcriptional ArsR family regulator